MGLSSFKLWGPGPGVGPLGLHFEHRGLERLASVPFEHLEDRISCLQMP